MTSPLPARFNAGDSLDLALGGSGFPPPEWSVSLALTPAAGGTPETFAAAWSGSGWGLAIGATASAALAAGPYRFAVLAINATSDGRATLSAGEVTVCPDPASGADPRSEAQRHLEAIETILADPSWLGAESYTIEGRTLARRSRADLLALRAFYAAKVRHERGLGPFHVVRHRLAR